MSCKRSSWTLNPAKIMEEMGIPKELINPTHEESNKQTKIVNKKFKSHDTHPFPPFFSSETIKEQGKENSTQILKTIENLESLSDLSFMLFYLEMTKEFEKRFKKIGLSNKLLASMTHPNKNRRIDDYF
ncbi:MAG: hypothetical protein AB1779_00235 [Candidatus Thermoplasmatota archaeon]